MLHDVGPVLPLPSLKGIALRNQIRYAAMKIVRRIHRLKTRSHPDNWDWGPPKHRPSEWPDDQDIRRFMEWLRGLIPQDDWKRRRFAHVSKLHGAEVYLSRADTPALPQTYVADDDVGGWYLMLAEAYVDHIADYEPAQGSRIIPLFK